MFSPTNKDDLIQGSFRNELGKHATLHEGFLMIIITIIIIITITISMTITILTITMEPLV